MRLSYVKVSHNNQVFVNQLIANSNQQYSTVHCCHLFGSYASPTNQPRSSKSLVPLFYSYLTLADFWVPGPKGELCSATLFDFLGISLSGPLHPS